MHMWVKLAVLLAVLPFTFATGQLQKAGVVEEVIQSQATIKSIIPLSEADLIRIDGNYENNLTPGVVCSVLEGDVVKGEIIIIHTRLETAYALITEFGGQGDFLPGDRVQPKRSITF